MASEWSYKNQNYSSYRSKFQWISDQEKLQGKWNLVRVIRVRVIGVLRQYVHLEYTKKASPMDS